MSRLWTIGIRAVLSVPVVLCILLFFAAAVHAEVKWQILSSANTNVAPGEDFVYSVRVRNVGDSALPAGAPSTFSVSVPDGLVLTNIESEGPLLCFSEL